MSAPFWIATPLPAQPEGEQRIVAPGPGGNPFYRPSPSRGRWPRGFGRRPRRRSEPGALRNDFLVRSLSVEHMDDPAESRPFAESWSELALRALEPNAFFEPGFALSAARHFPVKSRPQFIAVWAPQHEESGERRLIGLFPLAPSGPMGGGRLASLWLNKQAALASPLLDRDFAEQAVESFLDWLGANGPVAGVMFPRLVNGGPVHKAIIEAARRTGRTVAILDEFERAMMSPGSDADALWLRGASKKALKDLHRRQRRLAEIGKVTFSLVSSPQEVRAETERFLALEASGWKGASGAFLTHPSLTTFVRSATRLLAKEGKCRIASLSLDGRPLAMGVLIESQKRAYFWKIAFDESFRAQAPGIHLVHELTRALAARGDLEMTDSCAIANHPMIDRLWPDRLPICDIAVQTRLERTSAFHASCRVEARGRGLRAFAKRAVKRLLGRKES